MAGREPCSLGPWCRQTTPGVEVLREVKATAASHLLSRDSHVRPRALLDVLMCQRPHEDTGAVVWIEPCHNNAFLSIAAPLTLGPQGCQNLRRVRNQVARHPQTLRGSPLAQ